MEKAISDMTDNELDAYIELCEANSTLQNKIQHAYKILD